jgi:Carboxypeptidase regulatory-like domain
LPEPDKIEMTMKRYILFFAGLFLVSQIAFAQVEGDVVDEKEKAITTAVITATDSTGKVVDTVKTDERGFYNFRKLKPGKYKIEVKATGFQTHAQTISVLPTPKDANDADDTYYAEVLDFILKRPKPK